MCERYTTALGVVVVNAPPLLGEVDVPDFPKYRHHCLQTKLTLAASSIMVLKPPRVRASTQRCCCPTGLCPHPVNSWPWDFLKIGDEGWFVG